MALDAAAAAAAAAAEHGAPAEVPRLGHARHLQGLLPRATRDAPNPHLRGRIWFWFSRLAVVVVAAATAVGFAEGTEGRLAGPAVANASAS